MMCGGVWIVEREFGFSREFIVFGEFFIEGFKGCLFKELFDVCMIFWIGLFIGVVNMFWLLLRIKGGLYFGLVEIRRMWLLVLRF